MNINKEISIVSTCPARLFNNKYQGLWEGIQKYYPGLDFYFYHENSFEQIETGNVIDFSKLIIPDSYHTYDLFIEFPDLKEFLNTSKFNTCKTFNPTDFNQGYWNYNSLYWFRKAPAIYHASKICKTPLLIFLDADSYITPVGSNTSKDEYTINDAYINWAKQHDILSRHRYPVHTETGHIVFNLDRIGKKFIEEFYNYYRSGKVFDLYRWDDCWVFDSLIKEMKTISNGPLSIQTGAPENFESIVDHNKGEWVELRKQRNGL